VFETPTPLQGAAAIGYRGSQQMLWAVESLAMPSAVEAPGSALEWATAEGDRPLQWAECLGCRWWGRRHPGV